MRADDHGGAAGSGHEWQKSEGIQHQQAMEAAYSSGYSVHVSLTHNMITGEPLPPLQRSFMLPTQSQSSLQEIAVTELGKKGRRYNPRHRPLARSLLRPVPPDLQEGLGPRRRGRPPGSGNRKKMTPQKQGADGTKKFNSRAETFTGVYRTPGGRWRSQISHQGKVVQLGMYNDESAAAHRWDIEAIRLRGTPTQLNFPELKHMYLAVVGKLMKSYEGREVDAAVLLDEAMIRQEIQNHIKSESLAPVDPHQLKHDPPPETSPYPASLVPLVNASMADFCSRSVLEAAVLSATSCKRWRSSGSSFHSAFSRHQPKQQRRTTRARNVKALEEIGSGIRLEMSDTQSYNLSAELNAKKEAEKLLHTFQDNLDAPQKKSTV